MGNAKRGAFYQASDLIAVLEEASSLEGIRRIADEKGVTLERAENSSVFIVKGDYARLRQMLIVILDNAVKFTDRGGKVTVSERIEDGKFYLTVTDTGIGISEEAFASK